MEKTKKNDKTFVVALDGINLDKNQIQRIETGIKDLILKEVAQIDNHGDLLMSNKFAGNPTWEKLWKLGQLAGFWIRGHAEFPTGGPNR